MLEPDHYLPGQSENEEVQLFIRKHWISQLSLIIVGVMSMLLPAVLLIVFSSTGVDLSASPSRNFAVVLFPSYYLVVITYLYVRFLEYYLDVVVITNERIVDIDQLGLFNRQISELTVGMVQDAKATRRGMLQTFFDYGDVAVETAGESQNFHFDKIPHPNNVAQTVINLQEAWARNQGGAAHLTEAVEKLVVATKDNQGQSEATPTGSAQAASTSPGVTAKHDTAPPAESVADPAATTLKKPPVPVTADSANPEPAEAPETPPDETTSPIPPAAKSPSKPAAPAPPSPASTQVTGDSKDPFVRPEDTEWQDLPREPE